MPRYGNTLPAILILAATIAPPAGHAQSPNKIKAEAQQPFSLKSARIDLPAGDRQFPPGSGADAINGNCLTCHSAGMVFYQPAMSEAAWAAEVHKMVTVYKAPIAAESVPKIVADLDQMDNANTGGDKAKPK